MINLSDAMAAKFRNLISSHTSSVLRNINQDFNTTNRSIAAQLRVRISGDKCRVYFQGPARTVAEECGDLGKFIQAFPVDDHIVGVDSLEKGKINYLVNSRIFCEQVVKTALNRPPDYQWTKNALFPEHCQNILVEFSSPNIAKPFHIGHLRSTIIGNFVANIQAEVGHSVTRLNYLGDWGSQFGLLLAGVETAGLQHQELRTLDLGKLLSIYIEANTRAETDEGFSAAAQTAFKDLESGDQTKLGIWKHCRDVTIEELKQNYRTLNVHFDHYHGESMYGSAECSDVMALLASKQLLQVTGDGRTVVPLDRTNVTVKKSDGSSLYISRDIAAALDRKSKFSFDKMYYVVDNSQGTHFNNLFEILRRLGCAWAGDCSHVKFGKVLGMSTRRGQLVLMSDILEEATARMLEGQERSANTRVQGEERRQVAAGLGVSALVVGDLAQRRTKDYEFSWERALSAAGDTGVRLQYTHARLCSLRDKCRHLDPGAADTPCGARLTEAAALELAVAVARYDEVLSSSYRQLEAHQLVGYLFQLSSAASRALQQLPVLAAADPDTAAARLQLFTAARRTLADGLRILGITPLDKI